MKDQLPNQRPRQLPKLSVSDETTEFFLYSTASGAVKVEVLLNNETLWLNQERIALNITNSASAASSVLALPAAGYRSRSNGTLNDVGSSGLYWSSTVSGTGARYLGFSSSAASMGSINRANGFSVRCIKD